MEQGYWINYKTNKVFRIDEHERFLRRWNDSKKLGISSQLYDKILEFEPVEDREKMLLYVMNQAPVMRVRGHGQYVTFEFSNSRTKAPLESIWMWGLDYAGDYTSLNIINFKTKKKVDILFKDFQEYFDKGREDAIMEECGKDFIIKNSFKRFILEED